MPLFQVKFRDGRTFQFRSDQEPSQEELNQAVSQFDSTRRQTPKKFKQDVQAAVVEAPKRPTSAPTESQDITQSKQRLSTLTPQAPSRPVSVQTNPPAPRNPEVEPIRIEGPRPPGIIRIGRGDRQIDVPQEVVPVAFPKVGDPGFQLPPIERAAFAAGQSAFERVTGQTERLNERANFKQSQIVGGLAGLPFVNERTIFSEEEIDRMRSRQTSEDRAAELSSSLATFVGSFKGIDKFITNPVSQLMFKTLGKTVQGTIANALSLGAFEFTKPGREAAFFEDPAANVAERLRKARTGALIGAGVSLGLRAVVGLAGLTFVTARAASKLASDTIAKIFPKPTESLLNLKDIIVERFGIIEMGKIETQLFTQGIRGNFSPAELEQVPFVIEGTRKAATPRIAELAEVYKRLFAEQFERVKKTFGEDIGFIENYVNRIWDTGSAAGKSFVRGFTKTSQFLRKRTIPTLEEGIKKGLTPKTTDVSELYRIYRESIDRAIANKLFADKLAKMTDALGNKLVQRLDKAPADYKRVESNALARAVGHKTNSGDLILTKIPVAVHPEIAKGVNAVVSSGFDTAGALGGLSLFNSFAKKIALSISFFHHIALTQSALGAGILRKALTLWNPAKILNFIRRKELAPAFRDMELTKDAVTKGGVQVGALADFQRAIVQETLDRVVFATKSLPIVGRAARFVRGFNEVWDRVLWDYYHNGLKVMAYEANLQSALKNRPNLTPQGLLRVKQEIGQAVNDTFGGQVWERLMVSPKMLQVSQWIMLAPDWTLSVLRQFQSPLAGGVRGEFGRMFWLRAMFGMYSASNMVNFATTSAVEGQGRFMFQNDPGHELDIFIGRDDEGRKVYIQPDKQFREAFRWLTEPVKLFGAKLSPALQIAIEQVTGATTTGFDLPFKGEPGPEVGERARAVGKKFIPFTLSGNNFAAAFPKRRVTSFKLTQRMEQALKVNDRDEIRRIAQSARENGLSFSTIQSNAKRELTKKRKRRER